MARAGGNFGLSKFGGEDQHVFEEWLDQIGYSCTPNNNRVHECVFVLLVFFVFQNYPAGPKPNLR